MPYEMWSCNLPTRFSGSTRSTPLCFSLPKPKQCANKQACEDGQDRVRIPDAILTIFTGLLIGALLWLWQRKAERRGARRSAESGWQIARPHFVRHAHLLDTNGEEYYLVLAVDPVNPLIEEGN